MALQSLFLRSCADLMRRNNVQDRKYREEFSGEQNQRRATTILFLTMFIVMVGFGVIMPILPFYAERMGASATDLGLLFAAYSVVQFIFAPPGANFPTESDASPSCSSVCSALAFHSFFLG